MQKINYTSGLSIKGRIKVVRSKKHWKDQLNPGNGTDLTAPQYFLAMIMYRDL